LYRTVWRWHFYAGVLLAPVILIVSLSGGAYVFKREIETLLHGDVLLAGRGVTELSLDQVVAAAEGAADPGWSTRLAEVDADPRRSIGVFLDGPAGAHRRLYVDQYSGRVLGEVPDQSFFPVVLRLHRSLFAGDLGRLVTELTASWTILLVLSGLFLWWPRAGKPNRAKWFAAPRRLHYRSLRDMHAVGGFWLAPLILLIAATGLVYTSYWGSAFGAVARAIGANEPPAPTPPSSGATAPTPEAPWAGALTAARATAPGLMYTIDGSELAEGRLTVYAGGVVGPSLTRVLVVDPSSGEVIQQSGLRDLSPLAQLSSWNYPLHVGSVLGLPSKVVWAAASLGLALLPVTGVWMWLKRRPAGRLGVPARASGPIAWGFVVAVVTLGCLLPLAGASLAVAWAVDRVIGNRLSAK
jgi:uncharacterized iron-regulated membrane protein